MPMERGGLRLGAGPPGWAFERSCGCTVASPSPRSRHANSRNMRAIELWLVLFLQQSSRRAAKENKSIRYDSNEVHLGERAFSQRIQELRYETPLKRYPCHRSLFCLLC